MSTPTIGQMPDAELLELYQQISGRVSMYNTEVQIQRMFEIRKELNDRFAALRARVATLEQDKARLDWLIETIVSNGMRGLRAALVQHNEREEPILDRVAIDAARDAKETT